MPRKKNAKRQAGLIGYPPADAVKPPPPPAPPAARKPGWPHGRSRIPEAQRLSAGKRVEVHFLAADYARVAAAADRSGRLIAEFIRETVLATT
jgi:hypothetical protein